MFHVIIPRLDHRVFEGHWGQHLDKAFDRLFYQTGGTVKNVWLQYSGVRADGTLELFLCFADTFSVEVVGGNMEIFLECVFRYKDLVPLANRPKLSVSLLASNPGMGVRYLPRKLF